MGIIRKFDYSSEEAKRKCLAEIITRVEEATDEEIGMIAAQDIVDIVIDNIADNIYNSAIDDVISLLRKRQADTETEVDLLKVSINNK